MPAMEPKRYPRTVKAVDVAGSIFGPRLFKLPGGRALYEQVWIADGGRALYLARLEADLRVTRRWIPWDSLIIQMYKPME